MQYAFYTINVRKSAKRKFWPASTKKAYICIQNNKLRCEETVRKHLITTSQITKTNLTQYKMY